MSETHVLVSVRLGNPHVARAGSGKRCKIASTTSDLVNQPAGQKAAVHAAAKYFDCAEDEIEIACITVGDQCAKRAAIFRAEKGGAR